MLLHSSKNSPGQNFNARLHTGLSALYGKQLHVLLEPNRIELSLLKRDFIAGFKVNVVHRQIITLPDAPTRNDKQVIAPQLLNKLIEILQNPVWKSAKPVVILSNYFVRYLVLDWNEQIKSKQERSSYLQHRFLQYFGDASKNWHLREHLPAYGKSAIASGVSQSLLQSFEAAFKAANLKIKAIYPMLMLAANQALQHLNNHQLEESFWLVFLENKRLTLALVEEGDWKLVHNFIAEHDIANQISALVQREAVTNNASSASPIITIGCGDVLINDYRVIKLGDEGQGDETLENLALENEIHGDGQAVKKDELIHSIQPKLAA